MVTHFLEQTYRRAVYRYALIILGLACSSQGNLIAQDSEAKSYVLLEHGGILYGVTQPMGDQIEVQLDKGNAIQVKKSTVVQIASSKIELYEYQIKSIRRWGPNEHWHITQWCVQNDLIEQALLHFKELSSIVEPSSKLKQLEHQIKVAILKSEPVQRYLAEQKQSQRIESMEEATIAVSNEPVLSSASNSGVQTASATMLKPMQDEQSDGGINLDDEIRVNQLPSYVRKSFQQTITPMLVQRCGQSGCHGLPGKSDFHIYQPIGEQAPQTAINNLIHVLRYVDVKSPSESKLLAYATNAHGIQKYPTLNALKEADQVVIARIEQWIKSIETNQSASNPYPVVPSIAMTGVVPFTTPTTDALTSNKPTLLQTPVEDAASGGASALSRKEMLLQLRNNIGEEDPNAKLSKPAKTGSLPAIIDAAEIASLERAIDRLEKTESAKAKKDPFDPNEFNTRYGPKK